MFNYFLHCNNRTDTDAKLLLKLCNSALLACSSLHTVNRNAKTSYGHVALCLNDRHCLINGLARCSYILDHHNTVAIVDRTAKQNADIAVILYFLTIRAVAHIGIELITKSDSSCYRQWNSLISRSKQHIKITAKALMNCLCIILTELL